MTEIRVKRTNFLNQTGNVYVTLNKQEENAYTCTTKSISFYFIFSLTCHTLGVVRKKNTGTKMVDVNIKRTNTASNQQQLIIVL